MEIGWRLQVGAHAGILTTHPPTYGPLSLDAIGTGVDVHRIAPQEGHQGEPGLAGQVDRERDGADTAASTGIPAITAFWASSNDARPLTSSTVPVSGMRSARAPSR